MKADFTVFRFMALNLLSFNVMVIGDLFFISSNEYFMLMAIEEELFTVHLISYQVI